MKPVILMDLDGTLTDSSKGIINSIKYTIQRLALEPLNEQTLNSFIGPPLADSFQRIYKMDDDKTQQAVAIYREYYTDKGITELSVYEGIRDVLESLSKTYDLYVATSKPEVYAKKILVSTGLVKYFNNCFGADLEGKRGKKSQVILYALREIGLEHPKAIMIGDRDHDVNGAKENGLKSIGVLYGYGDAEELKNADLLAATTMDILNKVQQLSVD